MLKKSGPRSPQGFVLPFFGLRCSSATAVERFSFRIPSGFVAMPPVSTDDPKAMGVKRLVRHVREAALQWQIQHPPFWQAAFARLRESKAEIGLVDAARLLVAFVRLRLVDVELVNYCEQLLVTVDSEALLELDASELAHAAEALSIMQREEALSIVLGTLVGRLHRLPVDWLVRLLRSSAAASVNASSDLADTVFRTVVEHEHVKPDKLVEVAEAAVSLVVVGKCRAGSRSGLELLFKHISRRSQERPDAFKAHLPRVLAAAEATGHATGVFRRLLDASSRSPGTVRG